MYNRFKHQERIADFSSIYPSAAQRRRRRVLAIVGLVGLVVGLLIGGC